jgi:hypothetical protein
LLTFLETLIYTPSPQEEQLYKYAAKNSCTPEEILSWNPFATTVKELNDEVPWGNSKQAVYYIGKLPFD